MKTKMLTIRMSAELHRALKVNAAMKGKPLNALVVKLLENYVKTTKIPEEMK